MQMIQYMDFYMNSKFACHVPAQTQIFQSGFCDHVTFLSMQKWGLGHRHNNSVIGPGATATTLKKSRHSFSHLLLLSFAHTPSYTHSKYKDSIAYSNNHSVIPAFDQHHRHESPISGESGFSYKRKPSSPVMFSE